MDDDDDDDDDYDDYDEDYHDEDYHDEDYHDDDDDEVEDQDEDEIDNVSCRSVLLNQASEVKLFDGHCAKARQSQWASPLSRLAPNNI